MRPAANNLFHQEKQNILLSISPSGHPQQNEQPENLHPASRPKVPRIRKLLPELRKRKNNLSTEPKSYERIFWRLHEDAQLFRSIVQIAFVLLCIWIGIEYYLFVEWGSSSGQSAYFSRPPGAEGFLPISALISLKYWIQTEIINEVHPAGLFIFIAIITVGTFFKKAFCSWLCPIGTLSESFWRLGKKMFGKNLNITKWLDYPLRSVKYLLLFFFVDSIWQMNVPLLKAFIYSPYNKMADVKMYLFFADITSFSLWIVIIMMILSIFVRNFWCRYLCPYGGLLGILSWLSPMKIERNRTSCIDCEMCTKACPANIKVHKAVKVWSDECTNCLECVQVCPVRDTLDIRTPVSKTRVPNWMLGTLVVGVFVAITGLAMLAGNWQNKMSKEEYLHRFKELEKPLYQHNRGQVPEYGPTD